MTPLPTRILLTTALLAGAAAAPASAATVRHVEAGGTATAGCSADAPCGTVSDAVAAAAPGDTVRIGAGEFDGPGYVAKPLKFEGAGTVQTTVKGLALEAGGLVRHLRLSHPASRSSCRTATRRCASRTSCSRPASLAWTSAAATCSPTRS